MRTDVLIIRQKGEQCAGISKWLRLKGAQIISEDDEIGVIEANVPEYVVDEIRKLPCVSYVRPFFSYQETPAIEVHPYEDAL
jgi:hypothetical protein